MKFNTAFRSLSLTLVCALSTSFYAHAATPATDSAPVVSDDEKMVPVGPVLKGLVALAFLQLYYFTAPKHTQERLKEQFSPKNLAFNFAGEYSSYFLMTLIHELGHAAVANYINNDPINIHMGGNDNSKLDDPLFATDHFTLDGLSPLEGLTIYRLSTQMTDKLLFVEYLQDCLKNNETLETISAEKFGTFKEAFVNSPAYQELLQKLENNKSKENLILAAGGIAALSVNTLFKFMRSMAKSYQENAEALDALKASFGAAFSIDKIVLNQVLSAFLPCSKNSDGAKLWRNIAGVPEGVLEFCYTAAPYVDMLGECYLAYKDPRAESAKLPDKLMIGLINYLLRGYLRFHA
ncbi:hypothetical protein K2W90_04865 [Candidatus Babeliales bacterium]|nr:hypothetical protein [Candidatus Babeliales bacterium]